MLARTALPVRGGWNRPSVDLTPALWPACRGLCQAGPRPQRQAWEVELVGVSRRQRYSGLAGKLCRLVHIQRYFPWPMTKMQRWKKTNLLTVLRNKRPAGANSQGRDPSQGRAAASLPARGSSPSCPVSPVRKSHPHPEASCCPSFTASAPGPGDQATL